MEHSEIEIGDSIHVRFSPVASHVAGEVTDVHHNPDGRRNGILRVRITEPGPRQGCIRDVGAVNCIKTTTKGGRK